MVNVDPHFFFYKYVITMFLILYSVLQFTNLFDVQSARVIFTTTLFWRNFFSFHVNH